MTAERVYYPDVECEARPSDLYDTEVVGVLDETENRHFLRVAQSMIRPCNGKSYLPVRIVDVDQRAGRVLIQLPYEADSGANRLWVPLGRFYNDVTMREFVA